MKEATYLTPSCVVTLLTFAPQDERIDRHHLRRDFEGCGREVLRPGIVRLSFTYFMVGLYYILANLQQQTCAYTERKHGRLHHQRCRHCRLARMASSLALPLRSQHCGMEAPQAHSHYCQASPVAGYPPHTGVVQASNSELLSVCRKYIIRERKTELFFGTH
jgi:hypothetical protein